MTTYSVTLTQQVFKVTYEDPAGGFAGWFLHVFHAGSSAGAFTVDGSPPVVTFNSSINNDPAYSSGFETGSSQRAEAFRDQIAERLASMFGHEGLVKWTATVVEDIAPATVDTDTDGS